jgi:AcrR family transcriptional regulator
MAGNLPSASRVSPVRDRILEASYELFSRRGIRAVGVDELIERAGVAKASLYRHFPSKDDLIVAFLRRRDERWRAWLRTEVERHPGPAARARAVAAAILDHPRPREDR